MSHQAMKRRPGSLNEYYYVKEANLKRLQTVWFQLYDTWKRQNYEDREKISDYEWGQWGKKRGGDE